MLLLTFLCSKPKMIQKKWPVAFPPLSPEQETISNDFVLYWHKVLPNKYQFIDNFNQNYTVKVAAKDFQRTLEIGAGTGEHLKYERLSQAQRENYFAVDIRENMVAEFHLHYPDVHAIVADCQKKMDFSDGYFDRILAIHVLEHLPDLPSAVKELYRLIDKSKGMLSIVIPCEGGIAYSLARKISAQRIFEARYKQSYKWFIEREHINRPNEIFDELAPYFDFKSSTYFPLKVKSQHCNLCIGANLKPK